MKGRPKLLAALADQGVTEDDYRKIEKARRLVDEVNAALAGRAATVVYAVTMVPCAPRSMWPDQPDEILESERPEDPACE